VEVLCTLLCPPIAHEASAAEADDTADDDGGFLALPKGHGRVSVVMVVASWLESWLNNALKSSPHVCHFVEDLGLSEDIVVGHLEDHLVSDRTRKDLGTSTFRDL